MTKKPKTTPTTKFQSTHPYRMRPSVNTTAANIANVFQSTHPYRVRRMNCARPWAPAPVSIHAPVQGATIGRHIRLQFETSFQSTHPYKIGRASCRERVCQYV